MGNGQQYVVLGIVGDVRLTSLARDPAPAVYFPDVAVPVADDGGCRTH